MAVGKALADRNPFVRAIRDTLVAFVLSYLRTAAHATLQRSHATVIGIAGSVGKSTARDALSSVLTPHGATVVVTGNSETGVPLGVLGLDPGTFSALDWVRILLRAPFRTGHLSRAQYVIVEMGIDGPFAPKNMAYLTTIVTPDIGILLNETPAHTGNYDRIVPADIPASERLDWILAYMTHDDAEVFASNPQGIAVLNQDDPFITSYRNSHELPQQVLLFGTTKRSDVQFVKHEVDEEKTSFTFALSYPHGDARKLTVTIDGYALPSQTGSVLAAIILTTLHLGVSDEDIAIRLQDGFRPPKGRSTLLEGIKDSLIIDSSYNASPGAVTAFLELLKNQRSKRSAVFVFGDMQELGDASQASHEDIVASARGVVDTLILVGPLTKEYALPAARTYEKQFKTIAWFEDAPAAGSFLTTHLPAGTRILFKGSQQLEEAIKCILKNPRDASKLCRQNAFWRKAKKERGVWMEAGSE